eukprot:7970468-Ditylum_brightwellii.AAC.1
MSATWDPMLKTQETDLRCAGDASGEPYVCADVLRPVENGVNEHGTVPKGDSLDGALSYTILMLGPNATVDKALGFQLAALDIALGFEDADIIAVVFDVGIKSFCKPFKVMFGVQHVVGIEGN